MSIYKKLCLLTVFTVSLVFIPVGVMVYTSVNAANLEHAKRTFHNISGMLSDEIASAHFYLSFSAVNSMASLKNVLYTKALGFNRDMEQIARMTRLSPAEKIQAVEYASGTVSNERIFLHVSLPGGSCIGTGTHDFGPLSTVPDFKGRDVHAMLADLPRRGEYVVFDLPGPEGSLAYLGHFQPVLAEGMFKKSVIFLYSPITDVENIDTQFEAKIAAAAQEKLDRLSLPPQATVALLDGKKAVLAFRGMKLTREVLSAEAEKYLTLGKDQATLVSMEGEKVFLQSRHITSLNWYVLAAIPEAALHRSGQELVLRTFGMVAALALLALGIARLCMRKTLRLWTGEAP